MPSQNAYVISWNDKSLSLAAQEISTIFTAKTESRQKKELPVTKPVNTTTAGEGVPQGQAEDISFFEFE